MVKRILWADSPVIFPGDVVGDDKREARYWEKRAYGIGNGRLGCTIFGEPRKERIQFNEDSLWVGNEHCTGAYQPFGDIYVECGHSEFSDYRRELDISSAVHTVSYKSDGVTCKRESFSSYPAQVMVFRFTADKRGALNGAVSMDNLHGIPIVVEDDTLVMKGDTSNFWYWQFMLDEPQRLLGSREYASDINIDLDFEARVRVLHDGGQLTARDSDISFEGCDSITLIVAADTNYLNEREKGWRGEHPHERLCRQVESASKRSFQDLLQEHVKDYQSLYGRCEIALGETPGDITDKPIHQRVVEYGERVAEGKAPGDHDLEELLYQFARYLMISSSRQGYGGLPANLQGLWLYNRHPAWRCDYHTDVNVQMNYWLTGPANLAECFVPLAEWVDSIREVRKEETRKVLGVERGWLMRSENGVFGGSTYHFQKGDSAWVCQNLWDHYAFTRDKDYLKRYAYPVMKEISEFWMDHLKELPRSTGSGQVAGTLVAPDGRSPEHGPEKVDGVTYDQCLCWDLFNNTIEASEELDIDAEFRSELVDKRDGLLGPQVGRWGQLQEWMEDIDDPEDDHRHINHMIGVYPGRQIHPFLKPELAEAARVGVTARRDHGPEHPGWSRVWKSCVFARLLDGDAAYAELGKMMMKKLYANMWTTHPPFQIDCNFGYAAGVHEMLIQSHLQEPGVGSQASGGRSFLLHLLPALPNTWKKGRVTGIRARGGYELDIHWKNGELDQAVLRSVCGEANDVLVRYGDSTLRVNLSGGGSCSIANTGKGLTLE